MVGQQSRRFAFTVNNYTEEHINQLSALGTDERLSYLVFGKEIGQDNGTPHLQGYLELPRKTTLSGCKRLLGIETIHLEHAKGSKESNWRYCTKGDGEITEFGTSFKQGTRSDLELYMRDLLTTKKDMAQWAMANPTTYIRYRGGIERLFYFSHRDTIGYLKKRVYWIWGSTGCGKTRYAHYLAGDNSSGLWRYPGGAWFDGYQMERFALFDDFTDDIDGGTAGGNHSLTISMYLQITDGYPMRVRIKGGFTDWRPEVIIFTSNRHPKELYSGHIDMYDAVRRRITNILFFE